MTHELKYERGFDASPDQLFEAFTTHRGQRAMFQQDDPSWLFESDLDLRVGGRWEVASGLSRDELYRFTHIFREIDRPRRLTFSVSEHGPGGPSFDSEVEVTFDQRDGRTYLTYVQRFSDEALRDAHRRGIAPAFDRLERVIETQYAPGLDGGDHD
jgi:uncharacterized protein YndB with AHSA1/START domain